RRRACLDPQVSALQENCGRDFGYDVPRTEERRERMSVLDLCWARSEAERLTELEALLAAHFDTFREVRIEHQSHNGRIDLLALPKIAELAEIALAFEVKGDGFDLERALKQSADYVGARVANGPHAGERIAACFLYPAHRHQHGDYENRYHAGMFQ